jgi:Fe-S-cluster containining protein
VTIGDISRWTEQDYLSHIIPGLVLVAPESEEESIGIETQRRPLKKDSEKTACMFYQEDSNACSIRYSRPISCKTFPLDYDGTKFRVIEKSCPGIGKGEVQKDSLREARETAEQEFKERSETEKAIPGLYAVLMNHMLRQSAEAMRNLSEEERAKLDEIMSKKPKEQSE